VCQSDVYEFADKIDKMIASLSDEDYRLRNGRGKVLTEELLPLSRLALSFKTPGLSVAVEGYEDNRPSDGRISINGYRKESFEVEVTCTYHYEKRLRAELLNKDGHCPGAGPIKRDRKAGKITAEMQAIDSNAYIRDTASEVLKAITKKENKDYQTGTVLVVAFNNLKIVGHKNWNLLYEAIVDKGGLQNSQFAKIYLFNAESNEVVKIV
jgi:hypothetical protein